MTDKPGLDQDDLSLLAELVEFSDETGRDWSPVAWDAWNDLLAAGMVERIERGDGVLIGPTTQARVLIRSRKRKGRLSKTPKLAEA